jgi:hypothetical protein
VYSIDPADNVRWQDGFGNENAHTRETIIGNNETVDIASKAQLWLTVQIIAMPTTMIAAIVAIKLDFSMPALSPNERSRSPMSAKVDLIS